MVYSTIGVNPYFVCEDPCFVPTASMLKASMTFLGVILAPCGLPGKILGGLAGYVVATKLADKLL